MSIFSYSRAIIVRIAAALVATCLLSFEAGAVTITQLSSEHAFGSPDVFSTDFESGVNSPLWIFDSTVTVTDASSAVQGETPSGMKGITESRGREPLAAFLLVDAYEVGMYFGNDDFGLIFDAELAVYDMLGTMLGSVVVESNGNDFADQFIGLRSDSPFRLVTLSYQRPEARALSLYVDDFFVGISPPVLPPAEGASAGGDGDGDGGGARVELPEPNTAVLLGLALLMTSGIAGMRGDQRTPAAA